MFGFGGCSVCSGIINQVNNGIAWNTMQQMWVLYPCQVYYNIRDTELYIAMCVCGDAQDTNTVTSPVTSGDITDVSPKR